MDATRSLADIVKSEFQRWKGNENGFSRDIVVPLLLHMGFQDPHFTGGEDEKGIDVLYYEPTPEGVPRFTGIQVKLEDITAQVGGRVNPTSLEPQIRQAFEKRVGFRGQQPFTRISSLVICTTGKITPEGRKEIEEGTHGDRRLGAPIRFWDGEDLARFIERYWLDGFIRLTGITLPPGVQQVVVEGDYHTAGIALAKAGQSAAAIPFLQRSLWEAGLWLGTAHLLENREPAQMLRAAKALIEFDKSHYNQFWLAGYAEFHLGHHKEATGFLEEALRLLDLDESEQVQRGPGFQERYLQTLGMLIEIARVRGEAECVTNLKTRYRAKYEFVTKDLGARPKALGEWETPLHEV